MSRKDKMYLVAGVPGHWPNACRKEGGNSVIAGVLFWK